MAVANSTRTVTVNAAFFQEIKEVHQELWDLLDRTRRHPPLEDRSQYQTYVDLLEQLRDQLALQFALEEAYGYFEDPVVYVAPHLSEQAATLRAEHRDLYHELAQLVDDASQPHHARRTGKSREELRRRFAAFDLRLQRHEACEGELIQQQYGDDIGVGD